VQKQGIGGELSSQGSMDRPYIVFVYSQKFKVEGQGVYELKITNLINPYTMKATPLQPSLVDPIYMMAEGLGISKKSLCLTEGQISDIIIKQNNLDSSNQKEPKKKKRNGAQLRLLACHRKPKTNNQLATFNPRINSTPEYQ
jgi:hypothetical protein